jgi:hypothetical protein
VGFSEWESSRAGSFRRPETTDLLPATCGWGELHGFGPEARGNVRPGLVSWIQQACESDFIEGPSLTINHMTNVTWLIFESFTR